MQPKSNNAPVAAAMAAFIGTEKFQEIAAANQAAAAHTPTPKELAEVFGEGAAITDETRCEQALTAPRKVYVAHPLRGAALLDNIDSATEICRRYAERRDIIPFSPIHAFGFVNPMTYDQTHGMAMCYALLEACDELWVHGAWWDSEGCKLEMEHAGRKGLPIRFIRGEADAS